MNFDRAIDFADIYDGKQRQTIEPILPEGATLIDP
jgi:hypothetical protein